MLSELISMLIITWEQNFQPVRKCGLRKENDMQIEILLQLSEVSTLNLIYKNISNLKIINPHGNQKKIEINEE